MEEAVRNFSEAGACTEEEKEQLKRWELMKQRSEIWEKVLEGVRKSWLQDLRSFLSDNSWLLYDRVLTITWVNDEENEDPLVLEDTIKVRIQLPRELDELLEPGEITARLPYERGRELDEVICRNWDIICEAMDESFGQELEGWDAELYEEWSENVKFKSRKISYESWELYHINNKRLDQMTSK